MLELLETIPLSPRGEKILSILASSNHPMPVTRVVDRTFEDDWDPPLDAMGVVKVTLCRLRPRLKQHGLEVVNISGMTGEVVRNTGSHYQLRRIAQ